MRRGLVGNSRIELRNAYIFELAFLVAIHSIVLIDIVLHDSAIVDGFDQFSVCGGRALVVTTL